MWGQTRNRADSISHDHTSSYDPSTSSGVQEPVSTRLEDKLCVGPTRQASNAEVARNVETNVRRGGLDDLDGPTPPTDRGWGESRRPGSGVVG